MLRIGNKWALLWIVRGMILAYRIAADVVLLLHVAYVAFVVLGLLAVLVGYLRRWEWIRNFRFRMLHLTMIFVVVLEAWCGVTCPLTTLENHLRQQAGQSVYEGGFIAAGVRQFLFYDFDPWVFTTAYTLFGLLVVATLVLAPPRRRKV
jgi:hypothetical protein